MLHQLEAHLDLFLPSWLYHGILSSFSYLLFLVPSELLVGLSWIYCKHFRNFSFSFSPLLFLSIFLFPSFSLCYVGLRKFCGEFIFPIVSGIQLHSHKDFLISCSKEIIVNSLSIDSTLYCMSGHALPA